MLFEPEAAAPARRSIATLEDYLAAFRKRKLLVAACLALCLVASVAFTSGRVPYYSSSAEVLLNRLPGGTTDGALSEINLEREVSIVLGQDIARAVRAELALPAASLLGDVITASYQPQSDVITVSASTTDPERSAALADASARIYTERRLAEQARFYEVNISSIQAQADEMQATIGGRQTKLNDLDQILQSLNSEPATLERSALIQAAQSDRTMTNAVLGNELGTLQALLQKIEDLERARDGGRAASVILTSAEPSGSADGLPDMAFWILAGIAGLALGAVAAFLRERLDRRAQSAREIELALQTRVVGSVPRFGWRLRRGSGSLVMLNGRAGVRLDRARESYRRLRTSLLFVARSSGRQVLVVTSNRAYEGKSTTSANLAVSLALGGTEVALVSADLRRPSLETIFGISNDRGLSSYLVGETDGVVVERVEQVPGLAVIPAGPELANPGELLGSERFASLLTELSQRFQVVIVDTPPLGAAADALFAANLANGVVLVVDPARSQTADLLAARDQLDRAGVELVGAVINRDRTQSSALLHKDRYSYSPNRSVPGRAGDHPPHRSNGSSEIIVTPPRPARSDAVLVEAGE